MKIFSQFFSHTDSICLAILTMKSADGKFNQETEAIAMYKQKKALKILKKNRKKIKKEYVPSHTNRRI